HAVSRDGVLDRFSAPARGRARARGDTSGRLARVVPQALLRAARRADGRRASPAREDRGESAALDRALPERSRALRRYRRARNSLPSAPRPEPRASDRRARVPPRRSALRASARALGSRARRARRAARVGGGGWVNTELRALREPRVFDYFDYVTLDDGERPLLNLLAALSGRRSPLVRTYVRKDREVVLATDATQHDIPNRDTGIPTYEGLPLERYVSVLEMLNPMHRLWSDGRWNKITL